ncbi:hypothetical protein BVRB_8g195760 [Beta vulgaris subsp. vulgaris]|nr:hypothetical protein BVRB_8g195760 [Beta vulgaris subsp. vulgaris]
MMSSIFQKSSNFFRVFGAFFEVGVWFFHLAWQQL